MGFHVSKGRSKYFPVPRQCGVFNDSVSLLLIWRQILSEADWSALDNDIHAMAQWASSNLMKFHPMKCKVVSIEVKIFLETLPFQRIFPYSMNDILLPHEPSETDLGLLILKNLSWSKHQDLILSKALASFSV